MVVKTIDLRERGRERERERERIIMIAKQSTLTTSSNPWEVFLIEWDAETVMAKIVIKSFFFLFKFFLVCPIWLPVFFLFFL